MGALTCALRAFERLEAFTPHPALSPQRERGTLGCLFRPQPRRGLVLSARGFHPRSDAGDHQRRHRLLRVPAGSVAPGSAGRAKRVLLKHSPLTPPSPLKGRVGTRLPPPSLAPEGLGSLSPGSAGRAKRVLLMHSPLTLPSPLEGRGKGLRSFCPTPTRILQPPGGPEPMGGCGSPTSCPSFRSVPRLRAPAALTADAPQAAVTPNRLCSAHCQQRAPACLGRTGRFGHPQEAGNRAIRTSPPHLT